MVGRPRPQYTLAELKELALDVVDREKSAKSFAAHGLDPARTEFPQAHARFLSAMDMVSSPADKAAVWTTVNNFSAEGSLLEAQAKDALEKVAIDAKRNDPRPQPKSGKAVIKASLTGGGP